MPANPRPTIPTRRKPPSPKCTRASFHSIYTPAFELGLPFLRLWTGASRWTQLYAKDFSIDRRLCRHCTEGSAAVGHCFLQCLRLSRSCFSCFFTPRPSNHLIPPSAQKLAPLACRYDLPCHYVPSANFHVREKCAFC